MTPTPRCTRWGALPAGTVATAAAVAGIIVALVLIGCSTSAKSAGAGGGADTGTDASTPIDASSGDSGGSPRPEGGIDASGPDGVAIEGGEAGGCGEFTGDTQPTCSKDGNSLGDCVGGVLSDQSCTYGCLHGQGQAPASCLLASEDNFSCTGSYGTVPVDDGNYYISSFGCYIDSSGNVQTDPDDNCIPSCLSLALSTGLCPAGSTGPQCEEAVNWYTADGARFGCLAHLRITNPANGKTVIAVALDYGPGCPGENKVNHAVLDSSGRIDDYLFGSAQGASDMSLVHVVQVDDSMPLGPE
jgi:hypothetical protein